MCLPVAGVLPGLPGQRGGTGASEIRHRFPGRFPLASQEDDETTRNRFLGSGPGKPKSLPGKQGIPAVPHWLLINCHYT